MSLKRGDIVTVDVDQIRSMPEQYHLPDSVLAAASQYEQVIEEVRSGSCVLLVGMEDDFGHWDFPIEAVTKVSDPRTVHVDLTEEEAQILQRVLTRARRGSK